MIRTSMVFIVIYAVCGVLSFDASAADSAPIHAVFLIHEKEYETKRTVPEFAEKELVEKLGWKCTYLFGDGEHNIPGTKALQDADLLFISVRRQALPPDQLNEIKAYITAGKPVVGIRTASHAFTLRKNAPYGKVEWTKFDDLVLGGNYHAHYDNKDPDTPRTYIWSNPEDAKHPIMNGVTIHKRVSTSWLYKVTPLGENTTPIMWGQYEDNPPEPVAWTNINTFGGRVFYTSLGHPDDFKSTDFMRMLSNGIQWAINESADNKQEAHSN